MRRVPNGLLECSLEPSRPGDQLLMLSQFPVHGQVTRGSMSLLIVARLMHCLQSLIKSNTLNLVLTVKIYAPMTLSTVSFPAPKYVEGPAIPLYAKYNVCFLCSLSDASATNLSKLQQDQRHNKYSTIPQ